MAEGASNTGIASQLYVSEGTVRSVQHSRQARPAREQDGTSTASWRSSGISKPTATLEQSLVGRCWKIDDEGCPAAWGARERHGPAVRRHGRAGPAGLADAALWVRPPTPSSETATPMSPPSASTLTTTTDAFPCLATLVSAFCDYVINHDLNVCRRTCGQSDTDLDRNQRSPSERPQARPEPTIRQGGDASGDFAQLVEDTMKPRGDLCEVEPRSSSNSAERQLAVFAT